MKFRIYKYGSVYHLKVKKAWYKRWEFVLDFYRPSVNEMHLLSYDVMPGVVAKPFDTAIKAAKHADYISSGKGTFKFTQLVEIAEL